VILWRDSRANLSTYFKYPQEVRTLIYTTNAIEGFNRQLRYAIYELRDESRKMDFIPQNQLNYIIILEFTQNRGNTHFVFK